MSPRGRERRALRLGLVASLVVHAALLLTWTFLAGPLHFVARPGDPDAPPERREGIEVVAVVEVEDLPEPPSPEPTPPPPDAGEPLPLEPAEPEAVPAPGLPTEEIVGEPTEERPGLSVAERLRPRMIDPRLWAPVDPRHTELTEMERAELLLRGMIQSWNDSMAVAEALSDGARDWTYTDAEGRRWGLAPGRLHLGDFSIPLPFAFDVPAHQRREWEQRQWVLDDISRGAMNAQIQETWADRARMIRARMEAERAGSNDPGSDGGR